MHKFKRLLLSLSLALVFSVGFLSVGSLKAYAYTGNGTDSWIVQWVSYMPWLRLADSGNNTLVRIQSHSFGGHINGYWFDNERTENVSRLYVYNTEDWIDFDYAPNLYDYYLISTVFTDVSSASDMSFVPDAVWFEHNDCDYPYHKVVGDDLKVYHHDDSNTVGFTAISKIPVMDSTSLTSIWFQDNQGAVVGPAVGFQGLIIRTEKSESNLSSAILAKLGEIDSNTDGIETALQELERTIEEQYTMEDSEDFGVNDITNQVEEKLGVLAFTSDTLVSFLDLFSTDGSSGTSLTFPGFSISLVDGQTYQVWSDYTYDLKELESQFGFLITTIRSITVLCVWLALFKYLGKAYDQLIRGK